jgi:hypothetical protein
MQRIFFSVFIIFLMAGCSDKPELVVQSHDLAVFPNPFREDLSILFSNEQNSQYTLRVFDTKGEVLFEKNESFPNGAYRFDLSGEPKGTYHVVLEKDNTTFVRKVTKIE